MESHSSTEQSEKKTLTELRQISRTTGTETESHLELMTLKKKGNLASNERFHDARKHNSLGRNNWTRRKRNTKK